MKWHEACLSISAAILEILNAWENGVLTFESIQVGLVGGGAGQSGAPALRPEEGLVLGTAEFPCPPALGAAAVTAELTV